MLIISCSWNNNEAREIEDFLKRAKALLSTKEFSIEPTRKNEIFKKKYPLRSDDQAKLLKSLQVEDCVGFGPNNNDRYSEATVFKFIKTVELPHFGEMEVVCVYIKEYIASTDKREVVCVISLHEEGMYD